MSSCNDWRPVRTVPNTVSSTSNIGKTERKAAWEIWEVRPPARSSEYLRTTAAGTASHLWRC
jgi:hypothetical protein